MKVGVVGNGMIVPAAIEAMLRGNIAVTALWCRNRDKGKPIVDRYHIPVQYVEYDLFLKDDSFDTVYIGLVNSLHYSYARDAILAGKHVIVEKPFTVTASEAKELCELANTHRRMLFEAIISRYSKNYMHLKNEIRKIGKLKLAQLNFSKYSSRYDALRNGVVTPTFDKKYAGGALYDLNVYNIHFMIGLFGRPCDIRYYANMEQYGGTDTSGILILRYDDFWAVCTAAKDSTSAPFIILQGEDGAIRYTDRPSYIHQGKRFDRQSDEEVSIDIAVEEDPMKEEFLAIQKVIEENDILQMNRWLNESVLTVEVLEKALECLK